MEILGNIAIFFDILPPVWRLVRNFVVPKSPLQVYL